MERWDDWGWFGGERHILVRESVNTDPGLFL